MSVLVNSPLSRAEGGLLWRGWRGICAERVPRGHTRPSGTTAEDEKDDCCLLMRLPRWEMRSVSIT